MIPPQSAFRRATTGFTLVELSIVLIIVGLLIGGTTVMIGSVQDSANTKETQRRLVQAHDALLGFAAANGRLPCPAAPPAAGGAESPLNTGACSNPLNGYFPATTLGLAPTDTQGYMVDAWGNPIRYAVFNSAILDTFAVSHPNVFTTSGKMKQLGLETLSLSSVGPPPVQRKLLFVCATGTGIGASDCGTAAQITDNAVAVIFSMGKNGSAAPAGDESLNTDNNVVFVSKTASDFDDIVTWLSPNILYNRMIAAGRF